MRKGGYLNNLAFFVVVTTVHKRGRKKMRVLKVLKFISTVKEKTGLKMVKKLKVSRSLTFCAKENGELSGGRG